MTKHRSTVSRTARTVLLLSSMYALTACANPRRDDASTLAASAGDSVGCETFKSDFYDQLYQFPSTEKALPSELDIRNAFSKSVQTTRFQKLSAGDQQRLSEELSNLYHLLAVEALAKLGQENASAQEKLSTLAALEIGDSSTPQKEELQSEIKSQFSKIELLMQSTSISCAKAPPNTAPQVPPAFAPTAVTTLFANWKATRPSVVYGALKTLSTAYQSCDAGLLAPLDKSTPNVQGVTDIGPHPDGIGRKRVITNIDDLLKSHPYLHGYRKPATNCFDVTKNLPIYDYGGRPSTSLGTFDLFKSSGSGTAALGTDCSGYVYMAVATSGLRIKKSTPMKAIAINGITSTQFTNPQKNGLTCFDYVTFKNNETLKAGDIIAKAGHVVIVQSVGADPFGLNEITQVAQCTLTNMSVARFDFTVLQDSPSKGGVGIQSSNVADYLPEEPVMPDGLLEAAVTACKAKFGTSGLAKNAKIAVVRHSGSSACMNGSEIKMEHESCVASCPKAAAI